MQQVRIVASANMTQARAEFAALERQVAALNAEMFKSTVIPGKVNASGYSNMQRALDAGSKSYRNALASSGRYHVEQLKINSATEQYTELLQRQKLSMRDLIKNQKIMKAAYREQLALQNMVVRQTPSGIGEGRRTFDIAVPTEVSKELDTIRTRMGWINAQVKSASQQMVNWGKNTQWAGRQLMVGFTMPVAAFGAATGVLAYQVDKQLTRIAKVYDTTADSNSKNLKDQMAVEKELMTLRQDGMNTARESASQYGASMRDTLDVQAELAATGKQGVELQESTNEVMRISMLGEIDRATALKATISLQSIMGLNAMELGQQFDYLNAVENATSLSTADFAKAIPIALGPLKEMGGDVQDLGTLLVAMKERGIEAGEGGNAIKAMMQRLYRPSKQIREEWEAITKTDITQIRDKNKGNVMGMLNDIQKATEGLDRAGKVQVIGGLIGSYQVARINAVLNGLKDMREGVGQTGRVLEINQQSFKQWADTADRETKRWQESASGRFKSTLETFKVELAEMGEPFLEVGASVLEMLTKIAQWFNNLPEWQKKWASIAAIVLAVAGPLLMLVGLAANFAGNIGKVSASLIGLATRFNIVTKEGRAAALAAELTEAGFISQAKAAQLLTAELRALTQAQQASANVTRQNMGLPVQGPAVNRMHGPANPSNQQMYSALYANTPSRDEKGLFRSNASRRDEAYTKLGQQHMAFLGTQERINDKAKAESVIREKTRNAISGSAVATGVMAASMAAMMTDSGETVNNLAKWGMMATLAAPAFTMAGDAAKLMGARAKESIVAWKAAQAASLATNKNLVGAAGRAGAMKSAVAGTAAGFAGMLSPLGWIGVAVAGIGVGLYAWHKHQKAIQEAQEKQIKEQIKGADELTKASERYAESTGKALKTLQGIKTASSIDVPQSKFDAAVERYRSDAMKPMMQEFSSLGDNFNNMLNQRFSIGETAPSLDKSPQYQAAMRTFYTLQEQNGLTAKQAAMEIQAMYTAAGASAADADYAASELLRTIGDISKMGSRGKINFMNQLVDLTRPTGNDPAALGAMKENAQQLISIFRYEFGKAAAGPEARGLLTPLVSGVKAEWAEAFNDLSVENKSALAEMGVTTEEQWRRLIEIYKKGGAERDALIAQLRQTGRGKQVGNAGIDEMAEQTFGTGAEGAAAFEKQLVDLIVETQNLKGEFNTLDDVFKDALFTSKTEEVTAKMVNMYKKQVEIMANLRKYEGWSGQTPEQMRVNEAAKLNEINQILVSNQLPEAKNLNEAILALQRLQNGEIDKQTGRVNRLGSALRAAYSFSNGDFKSMLQSGMSGVQNDIADTIRTDFDSNMNASLDARQKMWDNRATALSNQMERAQQGMDAKWERRKDAAEAYYDRRIENVERAIKAEEKAERIRQRLFDAEMKRIERLTEAQNRNIDFNVSLAEGNFDEAAKIRNDMAAAATGWALEDAGQAGESRSENRINQLQDKRDDIEKQRQRHMKSLQKQEDAERRHLDKVRSMRENALKRQTDADMAANRKEWENRKKNLDAKLALFTSYIARDEKDLRKHMDKVGLSYDDFGGKLKKKGDNWAKFFERSLTQHVEEAGLKIASDKMWEKMGGSVAKKVLMSMGFENMTQLQRFVKTGKLPKKASLKSGASAGAGLGTGGAGDVRHEGGWVGGAGGSRKGVARNLKKMHSSEMMTLTQKGEYVVDRKTAAANATTLEQMKAQRSGDNGRFGRDTGYGVGGLAGVPGLTAAVTGSMFAQGAANMLGRGVQKQVNKAIRRQQQSAGFAAGTAGKYGDISFDAEQLRNAKTIANTGKNMGMSPRDIQVGIMTAITESMLRNVRYGDRDSQGLFQQRPSQGWGTIDQVTNPVYASTQFFKRLKGIPNRKDRLPWYLAQDVQRSAYDGDPYPYGSNYQKYWNEAQGIFKHGLRNKNPGTASNLYQPGVGGRHRPVPRGYGVTGGLHYNNAVDIGVPRGTPVYSVADGNVTSSYDIRGPLSSDRYDGDGPYGSYGRVITINHGGFSSLYAHLSKRGVRTGMAVKGGSKIGLSGSTGNSSGPHLHFGVPGGNPYSFMGLAKGASNINVPGLYNLHQNEGVLTEDLNDKFKQGVENFANGGESTYNFIINGQNANSDEIANKVLAKIKFAEGRKPKGRKN